MTALPKRKARRKRDFRAWDKRTAALGNAALAEIRLSREPEPRMVRWNRFAVTVTDRLTGERSTFELRSLRDTMRRLTILRRYYE